MAIRSEKTFTRAERLFLRHLNPAPDDTVADLSCADGKLAVAVAQLIPHGHATLLTQDATVKTALERHLRQAGLTNATVVVAASATALPAARFDVAYLAVRPYLSGAQLLDLLVGAQRCLRPSGRLLLFAGMHQGAPTVLRRAEAVFGNLQVLDKPGGTRIACCVAGQSLREAGVREDSGRIDEVLFTVQVRGQQFSFQSASGIFSHGAMDEGTRLLLETVALRPADRVVDVGCGYGAIGIVVARCAPAGWVTLVDANAQAVDLARRNVVRNAITNAEVLVSDGLAAVRGRHFDLALSNPPLHAGAGTLKRLTREAYAHLVPGGRLAYVVHRAYDVRSIVKAIFGEAITLAETEAFRVIAARRA